MFNLQHELSALLRESGGNGAAAFPRYGIVSDNKDPQCLGRVRVVCDTIAPGALTDWLPLIRGGALIWQLPDIGAQVLLLFVDSNTSLPVVAGCVYDAEHPPPDPAHDRVLLQTKEHRLEIIDEPGKEMVIISSAHGKFRFTQSAKAMELINELGDIAITCKKFTVEGEETVAFQGKKGVALSGDAVHIAAKGKISLAATNAAACKGASIKLSASTGVTTQGRQVAVEGDKVIGVDVHQMQVQVGLAQVVLPMPHPYIGKLVDKLIDKVTLNGKKIAVKGSKSKHDDAMHLQLPGTIKFVNNPTKEGEVTAGTGAKLKIGGKEAALIGSMVTTCNDLGLQNNSAIIALGVSVPMPIIMSEKNREAYEEAERKKAAEKTPQFTAVRWGKPSAAAGEELTLVAQVKDIRDGAMIAFQVWAANQNPSTDVAQALIPATVDGACATGSWCASPSGGSYFFTAHSAWCPPKQSGTVSVK
ncbi:MAG: phage baseplate assembly protein V [Treponema sp.]|nr:phage baseplate assembly protein V [Treponema sp.]